MRGSTRWPAFGLALAAALAAPTAAGQDGEPAEASHEARAALQALEASFDEAHRAWMRSYGEAESDEVRSAILKDRPRAADWFDRFLALADAHAGTGVAAEALAWVARRAEDSRPQVLQRLVDEHADHPAVAGVCRSFWYAESEAARAFLERCMAQSSADEVCGQACYSLAKVWKNRAALAGRLQSDPAIRGRLAGHYGEALLERIEELGAEACRGRAEELFERVVADHGELTYLRDRTLGDKAKADLFEMRHLQIGQVAPEIAGESIHGEPMKLSDYRGKVVVLDFWGDW